MSVHAPEQQQQQQHSPITKFPVSYLPQSAAYKKLATGANRRHFNPVHTQKFPIFKDEF